MRPEALIKTYNPLKTRWGDDDGMEVDTTRLPGLPGSNDI